MDWSESCSSDEKDEDVPEEVILAKNKKQKKEFSERVHNIESTKDKMWEADPNLGVWQFTKA